MFLDLVDALRCPHPHPPTWLVAAALETRARCLVRGTLGCPTCRAEYPIVDGVACFDGGNAAEGAMLPPPVASDALATPEEDAMRLAALLDLAAPGGIIAVGGSWEPALDALLELTDVRALVLEPGSGWRPRAPFGATRGGGVPVASGSLRGIALDARAADADRLAAAVRALQPRGRLVAPAAAAVPPGVTELARDARHWAAEREAGVAAGLVTLRRG